MTALLSRDGRDFNLACDGCGQLVTGLAGTMHNWDLAWGLFSQHGWTGEPLATGPHACGRCSTARTPTRMIEQALTREAAAPAGRQTRHITVTDIADATVIELMGDPGLTVAAGLYDLLAELSARPRQLVFDLTRVRTVDAGVLDLLVQSHRQAARDAKRVCLAGPSRPVRDALDLLCLNRLFPTFSDRHTALAWLRGAAASAQSVPNQAHVAREWVDVG